MNNQFVKDLVVGLFDLINAILTDFPGLVMGIINAVINIVETIGAMIGALEAAWERDVINGDARSRSRFFTYGTLSIAATFFTGGLDKVSKAGKLSKLGKLAEAEKPKSIPFNVMDTAKLKDYMKENITKEAHRYKKQINDFVQSNLFKTIVNMKALSNQAADIFRKAKHVLNPEKINVLLKKTYEDVVKGPLVRTKMGVGRMVDGILDTEVPNVFSFVGATYSNTLRDVAGDAKDTIVQATKSFEKVVGDVSGKIGTVIKGTGELNKDLAKAYLRDIEGKTGRKVNKEQIHLIKEALRNNNYEKLTPKETAKHRSKFTSSLKDKLIAEWEEKTNQKWPRYTEEVLDKNGEVARSIGQPYDAHHIIENNFGGPHEWWNIHPARYPNEHQAGIHGKGAPSGKLFPRR